jgi:hypothetical protein
VALLLSLVVSAKAAESFRLVNGETITGEALLTSANDAGIQIKVGDGKYERVPWANFSQEDLKKFELNQKLQPMVEPFIEITQAEKIKRTEVPVRQPDRLERQPARGLIGALFSSGVGLFMLAMLYAANLYAAYEISVYRARPAALVCGVAAIAPLIGPIVFVSLPTRISAAVEEPVAPEAPPAPGGAANDLNPMLVDGVAHPSGLKLHTEGPPPAPEHSYPAPITYQRGQFTFNRRFFETKFPNFFGVVRREADKDMVLVFKTARGLFVGNRIVRIASNDLHLQVVKGHASEEVIIPFSEVSEIVHKHKDAH